MLSITLDLFLLQEAMVRNIDSKLLLMEAKLDSKLGSLEAKLDSKLLSMKAKLDSKRDLIVKVIKSYHHDYL